MGGVSAGVLAGKLTGKLDEIAAAHKPNADKPTTGGKTDVDSGEGADYDDPDNNVSVNNTADPGAQAGAADAEIGHSNLDALPNVGQDRLLDELDAQGVKYNADNIIDVRKLPDGRIVFLETGNSKAGLEHITNSHSTDFANKGIPENQIPNAVFTALEKGKIVGYQGKGNGRPIYEYNFNGTTHRMAITVGDNGFIVGANPQ